MTEKLNLSLEQSEQRFRLLVEAVQGYAIYILDLDGRVITWNLGAERNKGYTSTEILGKHFSLFFSPEDLAAQMPAQILAAVRTTSHFEGEGWRVRKDGSYFWASVVVNALRDQDGPLVGYATITRDLTEWKRQEEALRASERALQAERDRLQLTLYSIADGVISTDQTGNITMMNPVAAAMTGWALDDAHGRPLEDIFHLVDSKSGTVIRNPVRDCLLMKRPFHMQEGSALLSRNGLQREVQDSVAPICTAEGELIGAILVFQDVTSLRRIQQEVAFSANHDALTSLPNRRLFGEGLEAALERTRTTGIQHAVCFLDLDRFKIINDTAGHIAGDMLLRLVADVLLRHARESDLVARIGGDEFALILHGCNVDNAQGALTAILEAIASLRFRWEDRVFQISASMGVAAITPESEAGTVMKQADVACYAAKHAGRNRMSVYRTDQSLGHSRHQQLQVAADIRGALASNRFSLYAQKISPINQAEIPRYELLLRMRDTPGNVLPAAEFIPAAEHYDLMADIDRWVLNQALGVNAQALYAIPDLQIGINLSANSLNDPEFLPFFLNLLDQSPLPPTALTLEITETAVIDNLLSANDVIEKVRSVGCKVALDDFGMGLCSFSYLRNFTVDFIKIDGSFVRNIPHSNVDLSIVKAINNIAHELHSQTIAESVENEVVLEMLKELKVDFVQGYGVGRPEPLESIMAGLTVHAGPSKTSLGVH